MDQGHQIALENGTMWSKSLVIVEEITHTA
jgi:hypothetical protein